jgi:hypothetical protein
MVSETNPMLSKSVVQAPVAITLKVAPYLKELWKKEMYIRFLSGNHPSNSFQKSCTEFLAYFLNKPVFKNKLKPGICFTIKVEVMGKKGETLCEHSFVESESTPESESRPSQQLEKENPFAYEIGKPIIKNAVATMFATTTSLKSGKFSGLRKIEAPSNKDLHYKEGSSLWCFNAFCQDGNIEDFLHYMDTIESILPRDVVVVAHSGIMRNYVDNQSLRHYDTRISFKKQTNAEKIDLLQHYITTENCGMITAETATTPYFPRDHSVLKSISYRHGYVLEKKKKKRF